MEETFDINTAWNPTNTTTTLGYASSNCIGGYLYNGYPYWTTGETDKGTKAYRIVKALASKKLVECKSASQFMALMDEVIAAL